MAKLLEVPIDENGQIVKPSSLKSAMQIHASESLMEAAKRARDPEKFEEAVRINLEAKRDFALAYEAAYPNGKSYASTGVAVSSAEFCRQHGFALRTVQRWSERLINQDTFDIELEAGLAKIAALFLDIAHGDTTASKWTGDPESYTPQAYIESARKVLGEIDLDPASNGLAQKIIKAKAYFSESDDGLSKEWRGRVFLNPPYKFPVVEEFISKLVTEYRNDHVTAGVLLTNNNTDTKWWHMAARIASAVCFTAGRINFYKANGAITQPTNGQTFFYFGDSQKEFVEEFSHHGLSMTVCRND